MKKIALSAVSVLALGISAPALADHHTTGQHSNMDAQSMETMDDMGDMTMTAEQQATYDMLSAERQTTFDAWPNDVKSYYFTLPSARQDAFWMLTDEQRVRVYNMEPTQREAAWTGLMQQVNSMNNDAAMNGSMNASTTGTMNSSTTGSMNSSTTGNMASTNSNMSTTATTARQGNIRFVSNERSQAAPAARQGEYPVCTNGMTDGCINQYEATGKGNRPLEYWPGRPASEIDGPLPAKQPSSSNN